MATHQTTSKIPDLRCIADDRTRLERSTLWKKLERFDVDNDGKLNLHETCAVFQAAGFSPVWAIVSGVLTAVWRGPVSSGRLTFTTELANIGKTLIKGQTGAWDEKGNSVPAAVEAFLADIDSKSDGKITLDQLRIRVLSDARTSIERYGPRLPVLRGFARKWRFGESFSSWVQLMEVAGQRDQNGLRYLTPDQVRSVFDGTLFDMILSQPPRKERVSTIRIIKEMIVGVVSA